MIFALRQTVTSDHAGGPPGAGRRRGAGPGAWSGNRYAGCCCDTRGLFHAATASQRAPETYAKRRFAAMPQRRSGRSGTSPPVHPPIMTNQALVVPGQKTVDRCATQGTHKDPLSSKTCPDSCDPRLHPGSDGRKPPSTATAHTPGVPSATYRTEGFA